jgi:hypothetical protein
MTQNASAERPWIAVEGGSLARVAGGERIPSEGRDCGHELPQSTARLGRSGSSVTGHVERFAEDGTG